MDIPQPFQVDYSVQKAEQKKKIVREVKIGILIILTMGSAFILGQYLSYSFYKNVFSLPKIALPLLIWFAVFLTFFFHSLLFIQNKKVLIGFAAGSCIAIVANFFSFHDYPVIFGTVICFFLFLYTVYDVKAEINSRIRIRFVHSLNNVTTKVILAIAVLLGSMFYATFMSRPLDEYNFLMPRSAFTKAIPLVQGVAKSMFGDIDFNKTMREIAEQKVHEALVKQYGSEAANKIPAEAKKQAVDSYVSELQKNFESILGVKISESRPVSDALYDGLLAKFNTTNPISKSWILIGLAVLFVFSIQALAVVVRILLIPVAYIVYEILLRTKFAHIVYENTSKETVTL